MPRLESAPREPAQDLSSVDRNGTGTLWQRKQESATRKQISGQLLKPSGHGKGSSPRSPWYRKGALQSKAVHEGEVASRLAQEGSPALWSLPFTAPSLDTPPAHQAGMPFSTRSSGGRAQSASSAISARNRGSAGGGSIVSTFTHVPGLEATGGRGQQGLRELEQSCRL